MLHQYQQIVPEEVVEEEEEDCDHKFINIIIKL